MEGNPLAAAMTELLATRCPGCKRGYRIAVDRVGKRHRCKHCGTEFVVNDVQPLEAMTTPTLKPLSTVNPSGSQKILSPSGSIATLGAGSGWTGSLTSRMTRVVDESAVPSDWNIGDRILDLYEVVGLLGAGAMGKVYRVHHLGWNLDLAVKSPKPDVVTRSGGVDNFEREAEVWVNLGMYPHTVTCYYVRRLGGIPRVFAEYVEGGSLTDWIRQNKFTDIGQVLDVAIQFAWGLHYAHQHGLIHQDIKPDNVMLTPNGVAKVTDFGLARARSHHDDGLIIGSDDLSQLQDGTLSVTLGGMTRAYCSPEQWQGVQLARDKSITRETRPKLTRKTDMWSWAVSILEIFTGAVVWSGGENAPQALAYIKHTPTAVKMPLPPALAELLEQCFQADPQHRPKDMAEVAQMLQSIYTAEVGQPYPRLHPQSDRALADSLNNRAVSLVDLGKAAEAEKLWTEALKADPQHLESLYNQGLIRWRRGTINDDRLLEDMQQKAQEIQALRPEEEVPVYLLGQVHLERRFPQAITPLLANLSAEARQEPAVQEIEHLATRSQSGAFQHLAQFAAHQQPILAVAMQGSHILTASQDHTLKLWNRQGSLINTWVGHTDMVTAVAISDHGRWAYSGSRDGSIRVWDVAKGQTLRILAETARGSAHSNSVHSLRPFGPWLLSGSYDNTIKIWDPEKGTCVQTLHGHAWTCASVSQDGRYVFSSGYRSLRVWDRPQAEVIATWGLDHTAYHVVHDWAAEYALLVGSHPSINPDLGQELTLWHLIKGKRVRRLRGHRHGITCAWLSPDHHLAISGSRDHTVKIWELRSGRCLCTLDMGASVNALVCDGTNVVVGTDQGTVSVWQLADGSVWPAPMMLSRIQDSQAVLDREMIYDHALTTAQQSLIQRDPLAAAEQVVIARSQLGCRRRQEAMHLWQTLYRQLPRQGLQDAWLQRSAKTEFPVTALIHGSDHVWVGTEDHQIRAWDPQTGSFGRTLQGHTGSITTLAQDKTGILSGSEDTTLKVWDPATGQCRHTLIGHSAYVTACGLTREYVISASYHDQSLRSWDRVSGRQHRILSDHLGVTALTLSLDQRYLVVTGYEFIQYWDIRTGECLQDLPGVKDVIRSVALSSDSRYVLAGSYDHTVTLWDRQQSQCLRVLSGHGDWVTAVQISWDGRYGFSASRDRSVKIWDLTTGECLHTFAGHQGAILSLAIAPDLRWVISGSQDRTVRCWLLDWELAAPPATWDISPYLRLEDAELLPQVLGWAGFGWLTAEQIEQAKADWIRSLSTPE
ncbi:MAG: hypothetical protein OHK0012_11040 [Synechococcales cyanobacterium]